MFYNSKDELKDNSGVDVTAGGNATTVVSRIINVSGPGSRAIRVDYKVSGVSVTGSLTIKLQGRTRGLDWTDLTSTNASKAISADGQGFINLVEGRSADAADMPFYEQLRVVITGTNAADAVTVDNLYVIQPI